MELIKKWLSDEYMPESQVRAFQLKVGKTRKALDAGKSYEEIAEILKDNVETAKGYVAFVKAAEESKKALIDKSEE